MVSPCVFAVSSSDHHQVMPGVGGTMNWMPTRRHRLEALAKHCGQGHPYSHRPSRVVLCRNTYVMKPACKHAVGRDTLKVGPTPPTRAPTTRKYVGSDGKCTRKLK